MTKLELEDAYIDSLTSIIANYNKMVLLRDADIWEDLCIWYLVGQGQGYGSNLFRSSGETVYSPGINGLSLYVKSKIAEKSGSNLSGYRPSTLDMKNHLVYLKERARENILKLKSGKKTSDRKTFEEWQAWVVRQAKVLELPVEKCLEIIDNISEE